MATFDVLADETAELGLIALSSPADPEPSVILGDGVIAELDSRPREEFDLVDAYIADHAIDRDAVRSAMAHSSQEIARMLLDPAVGREQIVALVAGVSPAKLAGVVRELSPAEVGVAMTKLRSRRATVQQALVTNRLDDPLLLAADAATAVAYGFRELTTIAPVPGDAPSNAIALLIGSQVGRAGALTQCVTDESLQLRLGMRGLNPLADAFTVHGSEADLLADDDTPWSKAFLAAAYASRGVKLRAATRPGDEALHGFADGYSVLYLQARAAALAKALGAQGIRTGGGASSALVAALPCGTLALQYENLMAMLHGLEACAGADTLTSNSAGRGFARVMATLLGGTDCLAGFSLVDAADSVAGTPNLNRTDLDDYLVLQRDWGIDSGLSPVDPADLPALRRRAAEATRAVYSWLGVGDFSDDHVEAVVQARSSDDLPQDIGLAVLAAAGTIDQQAITGLDVAAALEETGYSEEAERIITVLREVVRGDLLQTAAYLDETGMVRSQLNDPNRYSGVGTGSRPESARRDTLNTLPQARSIIDVRESQARSVQPDAILPAGKARASDDPRDVIVALSPAFGTSVWTTIGGHLVTDVLDEVLAGLEEEGCLGRVVRVGDTGQLGRIAYAGAQLAGSGIALALDGAGAITLTRRGLSPLAELEGQPASNSLARSTYRSIAVNAARHAKGSVPQPVRRVAGERPADFAARLAGYLTLERSLVAPGAPIEQLEVDRD